MRDNLIPVDSDRASVTAATIPVSTPTLLSELPNGAHATVAGLVARSREVDDATLRRLAELGFIAGEPVQLVRRGPGGREPLAVLIGATMFALRRIEAECVEVAPARTATGATRNDR